MHVGVCAHTQSMYTHTSYCSVSLENSKYTYSSKWLQCKRLTMPNGCELEEQLEFSHFAGGSVNWYNHIGTYLSVVTKAAHMTTLSNSTLRYMLYNPCSTKGVPRSAINNDPKLETT